MTTTPEHRGLLRLVPHARGKRSPVTCELKCGNACAHEAPNPTSNEYFPDVVERALSRRGALGAVGAGALALAFTPTSAAAAAPAGTEAHGRGRALRFSPIAPVPATVDAVTVPKGWTWEPLIRWGDPLFDDSPEFDPLHQTAAAQEQQFGYNNDYLDIIPLQGRRGRRAVAWSTTSTPTRTSCSPRRPTRRCSTSRSASRWPHTASPSSSCAARHPGAPGRTSAGLGATAGSRCRPRSPSVARRPGTRCCAPRTTRSAALSWAPRTTAPGVPRRGARCSRARRTSTSTSWRRATPENARYGIPSAPLGSRVVDRRPAFRRAPAGLRERGQPVRLDRRGRPVRPRPRLP